MKKNISLLIIVTVIKQLVWISFVPLWHFPDEQAHFGQISLAAEVKKRSPKANLTKEILISERILQTERDWAGNNKYTYHPEYIIPYSNSSFGYFEREVVNFPVGERSILTKKEATLYPPLYYIPAVFAYKVFYEYDLFTRVIIVRLTNILYTIILSLVAYKIFELIFEKETLAFLGTIFLIFHPMSSFVQAGINSDNLFNLIFAVGILVSLKIIKQGLTLHDIIFSAIIFIVAYFTKPHAYFLLPIYIFPYIFGLVKKKSRKFILMCFIVILLSFIPVMYRISKGLAFIPDIGFNMIRPREMNIISFIKWSLLHTYREILPWYWGVFRWLSLTLPRTVNRIINRILIISAFGLIMYLIRIIKNKSWTFKNISLVYFLYITFIYFLILTAWDYLFYLTRGFSFGIQGRYFFPVIVVHMGILLFGVMGITDRVKIQLVLTKLLAVGMIVLHEIALFHVLFSYFSKNNISVFFIQASQYKPWFLKAPTLQFIILLHLVSLIYLAYIVIRLKIDYEESKN